MHILEFLAGFALSVVVIGGLALGVGWVAKHAPKRGKRRPRGRALDLTEKPPAYIPMFPPPEPEPEPIPAVEPEESSVHPITDLSIGHIGKRIHVWTDRLDHTGKLIGIGVTHEITADPVLADPYCEAMGPREYFRLQFMPDTLIDTLNLDRAKFEVIDA